MKTVAEAILSVRNIGASNEAIIAAVAALRENAGPYGLEGPEAAGYVYEYAESFAKAETQTSEHLASLASNPGARGRERMVSRLYARCGNDFDLALGLLKGEGGSSRTPGLAERMAADNQTVGGPSFDRGHGGGWSKVVADVNRRRFGDDQSE